MIVIISLLANSADDKLMIFSFIPQENRVWHFMLIVPIRDSLHEMSKPVFWENKKILPWVLSVDRKKLNNGFYYA